MKISTLFSGLFKQSALPGATPTPQLQRRPEFEAALKNYRPSKQTIETLRQTPLVTLTAPTATGRNTIINALVKTGRYTFIVSDTTRPPRQNNGVWERTGVEYFFRTEDEVLADITAGRFVEAEVIHGQQVSGTSVREIERAATEHKIPIADVDIEGGITMARLAPNTVTICLLPPSFKEWIARINGRERIEPINLHRRLRQATKVFKLALAHDNFIFIINDNLAEAIVAVDEIASHGRHQVADEQKARLLAEQLYRDTKAYLHKHAPELSGY